MKCPHCYELLFTVEYEGFEIDTCIECAGIWLDSGELEYLLGMETGNEYIKSLKDASSLEKSKRCPICLKIMKTMTTDGRGIVLDQCMEHGLWFDKGELEKILAESTGERVDSLGRMLKEMFSGRVEK
jgi:Zn-finger nucleic acid-binding protein